MSVIFLVLTGILFNQVCGLAFSLVVSLFDTFPQIVPTVPARFISVMVGVLMMVILFIIPAMKEVQWTSYLAVGATLAAVVFAIVLSLIYYLSDDYAPMCPNKGGVGTHLCGHEIAGLTFRFVSFLAC